MKLHKKITKLAAVFGLMIGLTLVAAPATAATELLPNLKPLNPYELGLRKNLSTGVVELFFSAITWNAGLGPMETRGGEIVSSELQNVYQRIYYSDGTFYNRLAGTFEYHEEHNHFHFEDYAEYRLISADGSVRLGHKTSFCLLDTDKVNGTLPGAPGSARYTTCGSAYQGISVGWGDAYRYYLPGQSIDVTGLPAGNYTLSIVTDPNNNLLETNENDNTASIPIYLDVANMTVNGNPGGSNGGNTPGGGVTLTSMIPDKIANGATASVTIKGSGFTQGLGLAFINGTGPTPSISNIVYVDSATIKATVHTKKTKSNSLRIWDLKVGSAVLNDALTIFATPNR